MKFYTSFTILLMNCLLLLPSCVRRHAETIMAPPIVWETSRPVIREKEQKPIAPPIEMPKKKMEVIVIDAGHGGKDAGTESDKNKYQEKQLTLQTARLVQKYLDELGYQTVMTREEDIYVELTSRSQMANILKADLFVSVHYNFCDSQEVEGIEIFYYKDEKNTQLQRLKDSKRLGDTVLAKIVKHTGAQSRGVKTANFAVIRETKMPAILIEGGFLSNPKEREKLKDPNYRCYQAWAIARGIDAYLRG